MLHKIELKNIMEDLVETKVDELLKLANTCICDQCRADVAALALNKLPPRYVATDSGNALARFEWMATIPLQIAVTTEVQHAVELVSRNPRHGKSHDKNTENT